MKVNVNAKCNIKVEGKFELSLPVEVTLEGSLNEVTSFCASERRSIIDSVKETIKMFREEGIEINF